MASVFLRAVGRRGGGEASGCASRGVAMGAKRGSISFGTLVTASVTVDGGVRAPGLAGTKSGVVAVEAKSYPGGLSGEWKRSGCSIIDGEQRERATASISSNGEAPVFLDAAEEGSTDTGEDGDVGGMRCSTSRAWRRVTRRGAASARGRRWHAQVEGANNRGLLAPGVGRGQGGLARSL